MILDLIKTTPSPISPERIAGEGFGLTKLGRLSVTFMPAIPNGYSR